MRAPVDSDSSLWLMNNVPKTSNNSITLNNFQWSTFSGWTGAGTSASPMSCGYELAASLFATKAGTISFNWEIESQYCTKDGCVYPQRQVWQLTGLRADANIFRGITNVNGASILSFAGASAKTGTGSFSVRAFNKYLFGPGFSFDSDGIRIRITNLVFTPS
jgi:hypothetical protein